MATLGYVFYACAGHLVEYRRYFAHRLFPAPRWAEVMFTLAGTLGCVGDIPARVSESRHARREPEHVVVLAAVLGRGVAQQSSREPEGVELSGEVVGVGLRGGGGVGDSAAVASGQPARPGIEECNVMNADRGLGERGPRAMAARALECLWRYEHPVFVYCFALVSFVLVHGHQYITPVGSDAICSSEGFIAWASWVIPKLTLDCELIATTLSSHPYKESAIILDIWIFFSYLFSMTIGIFSVGMSIKSYRNMWIGFKITNYWRKLFLTIVVVFCVATITWMTLFHSFLVSDPYTIKSLASTLSFYGFGAFFHTILVSMPCIFFGIIYSTIRPHESDK